MHFKVIVTVVAVIAIAYLLKKVYESGMKNGVKFSKKRKRK